MYSKNMKDNTMGNPPPSPKVIITMEKAKRMYVSGLRKY
jgi:hypothetical protein